MEIGVKRHHTNINACRRISDFVSFVCGQTRQTHSWIELNDGSQSKIKHKLKYEKYFS